MNHRTQFFKHHGPGEILIGHCFVFPDGAQAENSRLGMMLPPPEREDQRLNIQKVYWSRRRDLAVGAYSVLRKQVEAARTEAERAGAHLGSELRNMVRELCLDQIGARENRRACQASVRKFLKGRGCLDNEGHLSQDAPAADDFPELVLEMLRGFRAEADFAIASLKAIEETIKPPPSAESVAFKQACQKAAAVKCSKFKKKLDEFQKI
jgi:hypothetical protein